MKQWAVVVIVLLVICVCPSWSLDIYISQSAGSGGNGTFSNPYSLDAGLAVANASYLSGDNITVNLFPGVYSLAGLHLSASTSVTAFRFQMLGVDPEDRPLLSINDGMVVGSTVALNYFTFSNLRFTDCGTGGRNSCITLVGQNVQEVLVTNVEITHSGNHATSGGAFSLTTYNFGSIMIQDSVFAYNTAYMGGALGFPVYANPNGNNITITNCQFLYNSADVNAVIAFFSRFNSILIQGSSFIGNYGNASLIGVPLFTVAVTLQSTQIINNNCDNIMNISNSASLEMIDQSVIAFNTAGLVFYSASGNLSANSMVWANNNFDVQCSLLADKFYDTGSGIDLCTVSCFGSSLIRPDRCAVCGGNDTCVGCDGYPFTPSSCVPESFISVGHSAEGYNTAIEYTGGSPSPSLFPLNGNGQSDNYSLTFEFVELQEVRPNGSAVVTYSFNTLRFLQMHVIKPSNDSGLANVTEIQFGYVFAQSGAEIFITETYYQAASAASQGNISFPLNDQTLKITVQISDWPFQGPANSLNLKLQIQTSESIVYENTTAASLSGAFHRSQTSYGTQHTQGEISFLNFAVFQRNASSITTVEQINVLRLNNESSANTTTWVLQFPGAFSDVIYDPDFGVILATPGGGTGDGGGANLGLILGLAVGLSVAAFIVILVIVLGSIVLFFSRKRLRDAMTKTLDENQSL